MISVPKRLQNRPTTRGGLVIPYATMILSDGTPDFTTNDEKRRWECLQKQLCPICGEVLDYWMYFIGGERSYQSRHFVDPAMHEECARYSISACPFLRGDLVKYREQTRSMTDSSLLIICDGSQQDRPKKMGLFRTRRYDVKDRHAVAAVWKGVEWF